MRRDSKPGAPFGQSGICSGAAWAAGIVIVTIASHYTKRNPPDHVRYSWCGWRCWERKL